MDAKRVSSLIAAFVVALNSIFAMFGLPQLDIDEPAVYSAVSVVALVGTWAWTIWTNFPFTKEAQAGQAVIDELKAQRKEAKAE